MGVVTVLVKRHQHVGTVARRQDVAGAHADLEDGRAARNRGRNRHVRHDVLVAATGETREEAADGLDTVLRVTGESDDYVLNGPGGAGGTGGATLSFGSIWADHEIEGEEGAWVKSGSQRAACPIRVDKNK